MAQALNERINPNVTIPNLDAMRKNREEHLYPLLRRAGAIGAATLALAGVGHVVEKNVNPIEYSTEVVIDTAQQGEGLYDIAYRIPGSDKVNVAELVNHIAHDERNNETLEDGVLQWGEAVVVPEEVRPR